MVNLLSLHSEIFESVSPETGTRSTTHAAQLTRGRSEIWIIATHVPRRVGPRSLVGRLVPSPTVFEIVSRVLLAPCHAHRELQTPMGQELRAGQVVGDKLSCIEGTGIRRA